jgi:nucleotide-binding universal stress UspA family protein
MLMKILLATDGSASAEHAEDLAAGITWPGGTEIQVLYVDQLFNDEIDLPPERFSTAHETLRREVDDHLIALVERLSGPGRTVRARAVLGRPATVIVAEAEQLRCDLVIIGSHGHGAIASFALGSVSAEVVDHAPCPVLIARRPTLGPIVLGHDGSDSATQAETLVATWPFLAREPVRVVSVDRILPPWYFGSDAGMSSGINGEFLQELLDQERAESELTTATAVARLTASGARASADVRQGTAAEGLLDAITETGAQLVVVGSRGNTGLNRLLLGSVARKVLYQAPCSVLIVRRQKPVALAPSAPDRETARA